MKKFLNLACSVCKRSIDKLVNNTHYATDKCTITYGCTGRLFPIEYHSNREIQSAPVVGVEDWRPRGTNLLSQTQPEAEVLIDLATGIKNQLVLGIQVSPNIFSADEIIVELEAQSTEHKSFKQFTYNFLAPFSMISGAESGLEKKVLRYNDDDIVEVFVNGVKLESGIDENQFQLNDGTNKSSIPANTIKFNRVLDFSGTTQVSIIVNKPVKTNIFTLIFTKHAGIPKGGAWDNIKFVQFFNSTSEKYTEQGYRDFYLFSCDITAESLPLNNIFIIKRVATSISKCEVEVDLSKCHFLLARKPFTFLDRYLNISVPLSGLSIERDYLKFTRINKKPSLQITKTAIETCFPPIKIPHEAKFKVEGVIKNAIAGNKDQITIDGNVIVGPDA